MYAYTYTYAYAFTYTYIMLHICMHMWHIPSLIRSFIDLTPDMAVLVYDTSLESHPGGPALA